MGIDAASLKADGATEGFGLHTSAWPGCPISLAANSLSRSILSVASLLERVTNIDQWENIAMSHIGHGVPFQEDGHAPQPGAVLLSQSRPDAHPTVRDRLRGSQI